MRAIIFILDEGASVPYAFVNRPVEVWYSWFIKPSVEQPFVIIRGALNWGVGAWPVVAGWPVPVIVTI